MNRVEFIEGPHIVEEDELKLDVMLGMKFREGGE
jgi:hypothetical protein